MCSTNQTERWVFTLTQNNRSTEVKSKTDIYDLICRNRVYECLGCGFVGREEKAEEHQVKCDSPMRQLTMEKSA